MRKGIIAIYARVSTSNQTTDSQLEELRSYCERRGWTDVQEFTDCISGGTVNRTGLDRLMAMVRRGKVAVVVAFRLESTRALLDPPRSNDRRVTSTWRQVSHFRAGYLILPRF